MRHGRQADSGISVGIDSRLCLGTTRFNRVLGVFNRRCKDKQLVPDMSRRGNCSDNAVDQSFLSKLKKERSKRRLYAARQEAKSDVFDYIEGFYNRVPRHSHLDLLSLAVFEQLRTGS